MPKHPTIVTLVNYQTPKNGILSNAIIIQLKKNSIPNPYKCSWPSLKDFVDRNWFVLHSKVEQRPIVTL